MNNVYSDTYDGLLTDYLDPKKYDTVLIRGIRNFTDMQYENSLAQYLKELKPDIRIAYLFCDKQFEHLSSSAIKSLPEKIKSKWIVK